MPKKRKAKIGQFWMEGRFWGEFASFGLNYFSLTSKAQKGDGHAVLVIPGFLASDVTTAPLCSVLTSIGYDVYGWGQGVNRGPTDGVVEQLEVLLKSLHAAHGKVSIIGWSLGGVFAREMGRRYPEMIRQIITLGSPFHASRKNLDPDVVKLLEDTNGQTLEAMQATFTTGGNKPPKVPCTAVFSKTDAIVPWRAARELKPDATHQNVEVDGTHMGLIISCPVVLLIADRLSQPEGKWQKFAPKAPLNASDYLSIS